MPTLFHRPVAAVVVAALLASLAACAAAPAGPSSATPSSGWTSTAPDAAGWAPWLSAYRWKLASATAAGGQAIPALAPRPERPLELSFNANRVGVQGGCNGMGGAFVVSPSGLLAVDRLMSTRRACETALMQVDAAVAAALAQPVQLSADAAPPAPGAAPRLRMRAADGTMLQWTGQPTPEARFGGPGTLVFMEVAARRVPCAQPLLQGAQCLQVRDRAYDAQGLATGTPGPWQPLYGEIEGYTHTEGVRNVLRVKRFQRATPMPADVASTVLVLDMVVETEATGR
jgi:heat shock protein HslJ